MEIHLANSMNLTGLCANVPLCIFSSVLNKHLIIVCSLKNLCWQRRIVRSATVDDGDPNSD